MERDKEREREIERGVEREGGRKLECEGGKKIEGEEIQRDGETDRQTDRILLQVSQPKL